jgi:hypothetical protein
MKGGKDESLYPYPARPCLHLAGVHPERGATMNIDAIAPIVFALLVLVAFAVLIGGKVT